MIFVFIVSCSEKFLTLCAFESLCLCVKNVLALCAKPPLGRRFKSVFHLRVWLHFIGICIFSTCNLALITYYYLGLFSVYATNRSLTAHQPSPSAHSLKMVSAKYQKELPNVLPNGNPFASNFSYNICRVNCRGVGAAGKPSHPAHLNISFGAHGGARLPMESPPSPS